MLSLQNCPGGEGGVLYFSDEKKRHRHNLKGGAALLRVPPLCALRLLATLLPLPLFVRMQSPNSKPKRKKHKKQALSRGGIGWAEGCTPRKSERLKKDRAAVQDESERDERKKSGRVWGGRRARAGRTKKER